jgi:hypothetical protein
VHDPSALPCVLVQIPPQQSMSLTQASLVCEQNELPAEQDPLRHAFEQHSE